MHCDAPEPWVVVWILALSTAGGEILALLPIRPNSWLELLVVVLRAISHHLRSRR